jgi:peptide deformylase
MKGQAEGVVCPCCSGEKYQNCCGPLHRGIPAATALQLMRSRYSAYSLSLPEYIIHTTHPASPQFHYNSEEWMKRISDFCAACTFTHLDILHTEETAVFATVTFFAQLTSDGEDRSFTERSYFEKIQGRWVYRNGHLVKGHAPQLVKQGTLRLLPIAYYGNPILRQKAAPIEQIDQEIHQLVNDMIETMDSCDGIGLAAPQVHHSKQLFILRQPVESGNGKVDFQEVKVFINPVLSMPTSSSWKTSEGCLSIPGIHAEVERARGVTVEYSDLEGKMRKEKLVGWEARIAMHEYDHLSGILFPDILDEKEQKNIAPILDALKNRIDHLDP